MKKNNCEKCGGVGGNWKNINTTFTRNIEQEMKAKFLIRLWFVCIENDSANACKTKCAAYPIEYAISFYVTLLIVI